MPQERAEEGARAADSTDGGTADGQGDATPAQGKESQDALLPPGQRALRDENSFFTMIVAAISTTTSMAREP